MSGAINKVLLVGHLGKDPELRFTPHGTKVARFSLATNEIWNKDGERREHTEWHHIVAWSRLAEIADQYLVKGSRIYLEGRLRNSSWDDAEGIRRKKTEIYADKMVMLDPAPAYPVVEFMGNGEQFDERYPF